MPFVNSTSPTPAVDSIPDALSLAQEPSLASNGDRSPGYDAAIPAGAGSWTVGRWAEAQAPIPPSTLRTVVNPSA